MVFPRDEDTNEAVLIAQSAIIMAVLAADPHFSRVVDVFREHAINLCAYSLPPDKHVPVFEQPTPVGSSRVVAGAVDVDEHVTRATTVDAMPMHDHWSVVQNDLACAARVVASYVDSPGILLERRKAMEDIIDWADEVLSPLNIRLRSMAPAHVHRLPTTINVALAAALCEAAAWPDKLLPARLLFGSPTTGDLPPTNIMRSKARAATLNPRTFDVPGWAARLHASVEQRGRRMSAKARKAAAALLLKSMEEARKDKALSLIHI